MPSSAARLVGVDAARGFAIIGMLYAHMAADGLTESVADGRSSVLFATLAGVSLGLITGGPRPVTGLARRDARISVALRALVLIGLGLALWLLGTPIAVILDYYGALFLVLLPVLFAPLPVVAGVGLIAALAGPLLIQAVGEDPLAAASTSRLLHIVPEWFVTGYYPGAAWAAYLCAGIVAARLDLSRRRTQAAMIVGGAAAGLLGYGGARALELDATAHSNTTAEVLGAGGLAIAIIGLLQLLSSTAATGRVVRTVLTPISAAGSMPLTIYTGQLVLLAVWLSTPLAGDPPSISSWPLLAVIAVASLVFATIWRRTVGRGPLEQVVGQLTTVTSAEEPARPVR